MKHYLCTVSSIAPSSHAAHCAAATATPGFIWRRDGDEDGGLGRVGGSQVGRRLGERAREASSQSATGLFRPTTSSLLSPLTPSSPKRDSQPLHSVSTPAVAGPPPGSGSEGEGSARDPFARPSEPGRPAEVCGCGGLVPSFGGGAGSGLMTRW